MKKLLKIAGLVLAALVVLAAAFVAVTYIRWNKTYSPPFPGITRATHRKRSRVENGCFAASAPSATRTTAAGRREGRSPIFRRSLASITRAT